MIESFIACKTFHSHSSVIVVLLCINPTWLTDGKLGNLLRLLFLLFNFKYLFDVHRQRVIGKIEMLHAVIPLGPCTASIEALEAYIDTVFGFLNMESSQLALTTSSKQRVHSSL